MIKLNLARYRLVISAALLVLTLTSCGGGSGDGGGSGASGGSTPPPPPIVVQAAVLDEANTGKFGGAVLQVIQLARVLYWDFRVGVRSSIPTGSTTTSCDLGGNATIGLSNDRLTLTETYNNCRIQFGIDTLTINGARATTFSGPAQNNAFTAQTVFTEFVQSSASGYSEEINGTVDYDGGVRVSLDSSDVMEFNLRIDNSVEGELNLQNVILDIESSVNFVNDLVGVINASGRIAHSVEGWIDLGFDSENETITFSGAEVGLGIVETRIFGLTITFKSDAMAPASAFLQLDVQDVVETEFFNDSNRFGPLLIHDIVPDLRNIVILQRDLLRFSLRANFSDGDGDLLVLTLTPTEVLSRDRNGLTESLALDDPRIALNFTAEEAGIYTASSTTVGEIVTYRFEVVAEDPTGLVSLDPFNISFAVFLDSDGDSVPDASDNDDDNDGTTDFYDQFPLDNTESADNDLDGVGDNADMDDDNDGTNDVDDAYPFDDKCFLDTDGDGSRCTLSILPPNSTVFADRDGVAYFHYQYGLIADKFTVRRYDTNTGHFLETIELDLSVFGLDPISTTYSINYVVSHHALYITYYDAGVTKISLDDQELVETVFKSLEPPSGTVNRVFDHGQYAVVAEQVIGESFIRFSFDSNGVLVDSIEVPDLAFQRVFTQAGNENFCMEGIGLNPEDGTFFEFSNTGLIDCRVFGQPVPSPDRTIALAGLSIIDRTATVLATIQTLERPRRGVVFNSQGIFIPSRAGIEIFAIDGTAIEVVAPDVPDPLFAFMAVHQSGDTPIITTEYDGFSIQRYSPAP